jgi:hypothetical protein
MEPEAGTTQAFTNRVFVPFTCGPPGGHIPTVAAAASWAAVHHVVMIQVPPCPEASHADGAGAGELASPAAVGYGPLSPYRGTWSSALLGLKSR